MEEVSPAVSPVPHGRESRPHLTGVSLEVDEIKGSDYTCVMGGRRE